MSKSVAIDANTPIVLYDGECHICNSSIQFILRHERNSELLFASLSSIPSSLPLTLAKQIGKSDAIHFVCNQEILIESDAVLEIASFLKPPYSWLRILKFIPRCIRNSAYRFIARNRHKMQSILSKECDLDSEFEDRVI